MKLIKVNDDIYKVRTSYSFCQILKIWKRPKTDIQFWCDFLLCLQKIPFTTFYFECRPISGLYSNLNFEFVIIKTKLSPIADHKLFKQHLEKSKNRVISFYNLSHDSILIAPNVSKKHYHSNSSIAPFIRQNEFIEVILAIFNKIAREILKIMHNHPNQIVWLNTHGHGVPWLHFRIDTKPKYITYKPYMKFFSKQSFCTKS